MQRAIIYQLVQMSVAQKEKNQSKISNWCWVNSERHRSLWLDYPDLSHLISKITQGQASAILGGEKNSGGKRMGEASAARGDGHVEALAKGRVKG